MLKKPFFGLKKFKLEYPAPDRRQQDQIKVAPLPERATLHFPSPPSPAEPLALKTGDKVKTGQKVPLRGEGETYFISTVTGTISGISEHTGYLGRISTAVTIDVEKSDDPDDAFKNLDKTDTLETIRAFMESLPGAREFLALIDPESAPDKIVINGIDREPMVTSLSSLLKTESVGLVEGINILKKIIPSDNMLLTVPPESASLAEQTDIPVHVIQSKYPNTIPEMIMKKILGRVAPPGGGCRAAGVGFISAEAVISLGKAFSSGDLPVEKHLTVITREGKSINVRARIGTPIKDILDLLGIQVNQGGRLALGGPMSGLAVFSEEAPILADSDAVLVQDADQIVSSSDIPCVNCGECVRACPADIPVNMLVRLLENGLWEEGASEYDLLSCIECGLCSYVCIARIPIFHFIMLGKSEISRIRAAEESYA